MATDENNHKNEARDDWTGCAFRAERTRPGRAWGMADILTDVKIAFGPRNFRSRPPRAGRRDRAAAAQPATDENNHKNARDAGPARPARATFRERGLARGAAKAGPGAWPTSDSPRARHQRDAMGVRLPRGPPIVRRPRPRAGRGSAGRGVVMIAPPRRS